MAPLLIAAGFVLAIAGWVDVGLFYWPLRFGDAEWEFGTIAQTFDAMPLATLGLVLVALGIRARGGSVVWTRGLALVLAVLALLCLAALVMFALDIPLALKAMHHAAAQANNQQAALVSAGLKRGMGKVIVFAVCYALAYGWMAVTMWRVRREAGHKNGRGAIHLRSNSSLQRRGSLTLRTTPAMAAWLTDQVWTVEEILERMDPATVLR